ncbi:MAG: hypothetical protein D6786_03090 [Gammaproteobacteria bacterium]|nr:MAG: hypothetical protein D6786_03090 [Gammaproteobacteria bacterium]
MAIDTDLDKLLEKVKEERDELRVRMHLASLELKEEWDRIEKQWQQFESRTEGALREATESASEAANRLGEELRETYRSFREKLLARGKEDEPPRLEVRIRYRDAEGNQFEDRLETALNRAFLIDEAGWEEAPNESTFLTELRRFYEACGCYHVEIHTGG